MLQFCHNCYQINMKNIFYYDALSGKNALKFGQRLQEMMPDRKENELVLLCIGSDRSTGDSLGPLVGHKLSKALAGKLTIYGTLKSPVHAVNLTGTHNHIGYVTLSDTPLKPGLGVKKSLPEAGDVSITGIVNLSGIMEGMLLQSTRLHTVMSLADFISSGIFIAVHSCISSSITCISR